jgi:hypothetical protein
MRSSLGLLLYVIVGVGTLEHVVRCISFWGIGIPNA